MRVREWNLNWILTSANSRTILFVWPAVKWFNELLVADEEWFCFILIFGKLWALIIVCVCVCFPCASFLRPMHLTQISRYRSQICSTAAYIGRNKWRLNMILILFGFVICVIITKWYHAQRQTIFYIQIYFHTMFICMRLTGDRVDGRKMGYDSADHSLINILKYWWIDNIINSFMHID